MDIKTLSRRTSLSVRQIRYVLDHKLVPLRTWFVDEFAVGRARAFDEVTAVLIACAAYLLCSGCKRTSVKGLLESLNRVYPQGRNPLNLPVIANFVTGSSTAKIQFGDGRYVRWVTPSGPGEWIDTSAPNSEVFSRTPRVIIELNLSEIRDEVLEFRQKNS